MVKTEFALLGCDDLPQEIENAVPQYIENRWTFVGDLSVPPKLLIINCCNRDMLLTEYVFGSSGSDKFSHVYFNVCETCHAVYWARHGEQFEHVDIYIPF